jgi:hypothetical protein
MSIVKRINTNLRRTTEREETAKQSYTRGNQSESAHKHIRRRTAAMYDTPVGNCAETVVESTDDAKYNNLSKPENIKFSRKNSVVSHKNSW